MVPASLFIAWISASTSVPLAFELQTPTGPEWAARRAEMVTIVTDTLTVRTRMSVRSLDDLAIDAVRKRRCRKQPSLKCWVGALEGIETGLFASEPGRKGMQFLLAKLLPLPRKDRVLVLLWLVDLEEASRGIIGLDRARAEGWILRHATVRRRIEVQWGDGAVTTLLERLWDERQGHFERRGLWWPNGSIRIETEWVPPFQVAIDDESSRTSTAATIRLRPMAAGTHTVRLVSSDAQIERKVTVEMGRQAILHIDEPGVSTASPYDARPALLWTGVGVAVLGAGVAIAGLAAPVQGERIQLCSANEPNCDRAAPFARMSDYFSARTRADDGDGPLVVPLGYSLVVTGLAWSLISLLYDEPDVPWWSVVLAAGLGGLAYGISEAAN